MCFLFHKVANIFVNFGSLQKLLSLKGMKLQFSEIEIKYKLSYCEDIGKQKDRKESIIGKNRVEISLWTSEPR